MFCFICSSYFFSFCGSTVLSTDLMWLYSDNSYPSHPDQGQSVSRFSLLQTVPFHSSVWMCVAVVVVLLNDKFRKKLSSLDCVSILSMSSELSSASLIGPKWKEMPGCESGLERLIRGDLWKNIWGSEISPATSVQRELGINTVFNGESLRPLDFKVTS